MSAYNSIVISILARVQAQVTRELPKGTYHVPASDTLVALAKDLGFIEGRRGRSGGFEPTDAGLQFMKMDVEQYRAKQALGTVQSRQQQLEEARKAREQRLAQLEEELRKANKEVNA